MTRSDDRVIVTPEHVPVRLTPAGPGARYLACLVDLFIVLAVTTAFDLVLGSFLPRGISQAASATIFFVLLWGYHIYYETRRRGGTPGKRMAGLRVVDGMGLPLTLEQSFVRNAVRALDMLPLLGGFGVLASLLDRHHRRLGDLAADTLVIQEDPPAAARTAPAPLRKFNSLRTPRVLRLIRHRIGLEEREFLLDLCLRTERLAPDVRVELMEAAGGHYRRRLGIDDPHLSGENLVRDLTAILFETTRGG